MHFLVKRFDTKIFGGQYDKILIILFGQMHLYELHLIFGRVAWLEGGNLEYICA
ncbi:hypothetical protein HMPREF0083_03729 [Aneurinibacillus aneurinilyticus ATCC 12856]|uniref:Uncharacterized protein n=1 Tax=Aneurinibacillus aneurinilyticus ATCC 12856 TaxID=649747 RepID=U1YBL9_ANEAE|nr:hypothetical protein HMPREF0083_03729 [Aneurinibacillus aneurinilyticus ATCC 12856]